ncbi:MAG: UDP-N-acetylglucosamine pyrophosphorylase, partial [Lachnospiraceae bacterium]|nr:UDP-N-acetylglucosamine pyrophosphorylase [Lachnospiraceae bacterium]
MENAKIINLFDLNETLASDYLKGFIYPWEALKGIGQMIKELGPTLDPSVYENKGENIWIARSASIADISTITGPCIIGENTEVRPGAFIRGNALVGNNCVIGNSVELKNVIIFNESQVPHFNYVGDSILGLHAHMGAGSITSNVKADNKNIVIKDRVSSETMETGIRKIGAMLGDHAEIGCNAVLNPGTIIGRNTNVYPTSSVRGVIPA